jgi:hypothetical protein
VFVTLALHHMVPLARRNPVDADVAAGAAADEGSAGSGGAPPAASASQAAAGPVEAAAPPRVGSDPVYRVFDRATTVARMRGGAACSAVLKWMSAVALRLPAAETRRYMVPCARLLYRLTSSDAPDTQLAPSVRALAAEAVDLLQSHAGAQAFLRAFNAERGRTTTRRLARRRDRALQKVLDPAAAARLKAKKQAGKVRAKARRISEYRLLKGKPTDGTGSSRAARDAADDEPQRHIFRAGGEHARVPGGPAASASAGGRSGGGSGGRGGGGGRGGRGGRGRGGGGGRGGSSSRGGSGGRGGRMTGSKRSRWD